MSAEKMAFQLSIEDTVTALKEKISQVEQEFVIENQKLTYRGTALEDSKTLKELDIQNDSIIQLLILTSYEKGFLLSFSIFYIYEKKIFFFPKN